MSHLQSMEAPGQFFVWASNCICWAGHIVGHSASDSSCIHTTAKFVTKCLEVKGKNMGRLSGAFQKLRCVVVWEVYVWEKL